MSISGGDEPYAVRLAGMRRADLKTPETLARGRAGQVESSVGTFELGFLWVGLWEGFESASMRLLLERC